jgi:hypothetical protein
MTRPLSLALRAFFTVAPLALVAFVFVLLGALSSVRLSAFVLALIFGALVGLAERAAFDRAALPRPHRYVLFSGLGWLAWAVVAALVGVPLASALPFAGAWSSFLLLMGLPAFVGAVVASFVQARTPLGLRYGLGLAVTRTLAVLTVAAVYRAGADYAGMALGATVYGLGFLAVLAGQRAVRPGQRTMASE